MKRRLTSDQEIIAEIQAARMREWGHDTEELVGLLKITEEDIYERFLDRLYEFSTANLGGLDSEEHGGDIEDAES